MNQRGGVKDDRDRQKLPEQDMVMDAPCQRIEGDIAECVVEEMADQIGKQHQPADEPDLTQADAANES